MGNITCAECGVIFHIPDRLEKLRRDDHGTFYCPNGHSQYFRGKTDEEKKIESLREQIASLENRLDIERGITGDYQDFYNEAEKNRMKVMREMRKCPMGCGWRTKRIKPEGVRED